MEEIVLKLSKAEDKVSPSDVRTNSVNSTWKTVLNSPITLEEPMELRLRNAFVDTQDSSGTIILEEDTDIELTCGFWLQDWTDANKVYSGPLPATTWPAAGSSTVDSGGVAQSPGTYVACDYKIVSDTGDPPVITKGIDFYYGYDMVQKVVLVVTYTNWPANQVVKKNIHAKATKQGGTKFTVPVNLIRTSGTTITLDNENDLKTKDRWFFDKFDSVPGKADDAIFDIHEQELKFTIPAGAYPPKTLASLITAEMSKNELEQKAATRSIISQVCWSSNDLLVHHTGPGNVAWVSANWPDDATPQYFQINPAATTAYWVGATQIALTFDETANRFSWAFMHTPLEPGVNGPGVQYISYQIGASPNPHWLATAHSGLFLKAVEPFDFWEQKLGFNLASLLPYTPSTNVPIGNFLSGHVPNFDLIPGRHIVTAYAGLDVGILKKDTFFYSNNVPATLVPTNLTTEITAEEPPVDPATDSTHFIIEVEGIPNRRLIGSDNILHSTSAIVGRFQTRGSVTEADSTAGVNLTFKGAPQTISELRVSIYDPDGLPSTLGPNSTIYLSLFRPIPTPNPLPGSEPNPKKSKKNK